MSLPSSAMTYLTLTDSQHILVSTSVVALEQYSFQPESVNTFSEFYISFNILCNTYRGLKEKSFISFFGG